jgi:CubicO group peptidase (beta-lactamase class C family)
MSDIKAWHGKNGNEHTSLRDDAAGQGYRFLSLSIYGSTASPVYAAVMIRRPLVVAQRDWPALTADKLEETFNDQASKGYGPVIIAATGPASSPLFAVVFQPQNPIPLTRHLLKSGSASDAGTIQGMNAQAKSQGLILHWAAAYGDSSNPGFAGIWVPNPGKTFWNADGVSDSAGEFQGRFNTETSGWCRVGFVTLNKDSQYLSLFVDNEVSGSWYARHAMTPSDYQIEFDSWTGKGFLPACVQAAGSDKNSARLAAIFVKSENTVPKQFTATGPTANTGIDKVIRQAMQDSPVRHASLAIVYRTKLVYARGYAMAEPDWPAVQPTTCFRLASVSKCSTALAIYQLIEAGMLKLTHTLQYILQLKTPSGGAPHDAKFKDITIQHLLEHTSGINADAFRNGVDVRNAFIASGHAVTLPVSELMTDSYIASLGLVSKPGDTQTYNNCGYYLLSRVVAKLRNASKAIDAYQQYLYKPLSITRIRRAESLIASQPSDEARYQEPNLKVLASQMSDVQPLVPDEYGSEQVGLMEGAGGLTGAATDVARLIAILISQNDNPALKRATLASMLSAGAKLNAAGMGRAGYGFDYLQNFNDGRFYGQKGGSLDSSGNVLQFDGDWGFAMQWGGKAYAATGFYPNYPAVMNVAKSAAWGNEDLFPQFGMPSF